MPIEHADTTPVYNSTSWLLPHTGNGLDWYNVMDAPYNAANDRTTDDLPAIQAALDDAGAAGGGVVYLPPGDGYFLDSLEVASQAHLYNPYSNVSMQGVGGGSVLYADDDYSILYQGQTTRFVDATVYPVTASVAKGAVTITTATAAHAGNFAAGDYIYIRTGQTIGAGGGGLVDQPDAEINRVVSAVAGTGVITLAWPTAKAYAQEYFISGTSGESSTGVTANAAVFGVSNITSLVTQAQTYRNIRFEHAGTGDTGYGIIGGQVIHSLVENCSYLGKTGFESIGTHRFHTVRDCFLDHTGAAGTYIYTLTADTGCSDTTWANNQIVGSHPVSVHIQEGAAGVKVLGNSWNVPDTVSDLNHISIRSRAYDISVIGNIHRGSTPSVIVVDPDCTGGGVIADNQLLGSTGYGVFVAASGWTVTGNRHPNGAKHYALGVTGIDSELRIMGAWVTKDDQTAFLGRLPANVAVVRVGMHVTQAFNGSGTDTISGGFGADNTGFWAATDVSTTGIKSPTIGPYAVYSPAEHDVYAYYVNGGGEPTTGKCFAWLEYGYMPEQP